MKTDLKSLSDKQLEKLKNDVDKAIASRSRAKKAAARKAAEDAARKHGFSLSEILADAPKAAKPKAKPKARAKAAAKYRNPADASQTWTGRGRQPAWFKAAVAAGKSPDDLAV